MNEKIKWYAFLVLICVLFGTQSPALKVLSSSFSPFQLSFYRFLFASLALVPFFLLHNRKKKVGIKPAFGIAIVGLIGIALYSIINIFGIKLSTAINQSILVNTWPIFLVALAPIVIKEKVYKRAALGITVGFFGVLVTLAGKGNPIDIFKTDYFFGNLLILTSSLCLAFYYMLGKKYVQDYGSLTVTFYAVIAGTILLFLSALASGNIFNPELLRLKIFLILLWVAVPTTAFTWVMVFKSMEKIGIVETSSFFSAIPIFGVLFSNLLLQEKITPFSLAGALFVAFGVYLVQTKRNMRPVIE